MPGNKKTFKKKAMPNKYKNSKKQPNPKVQKSLAVLGQGLPKKILVTHKYNQYVNLYNVSGVTQHFQVSCNGMYNPGTSGAHQPLYFDQFSALYNHYTVIGSKITFRIAQNNTTQYTTKVALWINDDTSTVPTYEALSEQSGSKNFIMAAGATTVQTHTMKWSAKKAFGGSILGNTLFRGNATNNPIEQSYYQVSAYQTSAAPIALDVDMTIEYIVVWTELKDIAQS